MSRGDEVTPLDPGILQGSLSLPLAPHRYWLLRTMISLLVCELEISISVLAGGAVGVRTISITYEHIRGDE